MHPNDHLRVSDLPAPDWPCAKPAGALATQAWEALELSSDGIMVLDDKAVIIRSNTQALELLQCMLADVSGRATIVRRHQRDRVERGRRRV